jgi:endonuclease/exonuclease/phosphatase family metal-dependent hydrolase
MENQGQSLVVQAALQRTEYVARACQPWHKEFIRLVHWNIEKGKRWGLLERCLMSDSVRFADILCLNEVDYGMARSGNRHVAFEIADRLGMSVVFGPAFYEFTKGVGEERLVPEENTMGIQGNAVLTRFPVLGYENIPLPSCHDPSNSEEKRAGGRAALIVQMETPMANFAVVVTHLEVVTTVACRAVQMQAVLNRLNPWPVAVIAGDLNTNTFDRGSAFSTIQSLIKLLGPNVKGRVSQPWVFEPLFDSLKSRGFDWRPFNDATPTNLVDLATLEDKKYVPEIVMKLALKRGRFLPLRLDWIAGRGCQAHSPGKTITDLPCEPSDHLPISCDIVPGA